jgi:hypothetical protein
VRPRRGGQGAGLLFTRGPANCPGHHKHNARARHVLRGEHVQVRSNLAIRATGRPSSAKNEGRSSAFLGKLYPPEKPKMLAGATQGPSGASQRRHL